MRGSCGAGVTAKAMREVCGRGLLNDGIKDLTALFVSLNMNGSLAVIPVAAAPGSTGTVGDEGCFSRLRFGLSGMHSSNRSMV